MLAVQDVRVGAYHFPPYVMKPESPQPEGLLPELLELLNGVQKDYRFVLIPTAAMRRYRDLESGRYDLILFESPGWGWHNTPHVSADLQLEDAEVYVALNKPGRNQLYFDQLQGKRMALYSGYHYGFAGFNADQQFLTQKFGALLTYSHDSNLSMILRERADIAVITRSYLNMYLKRHPAKAQALLVSDRVDQVYQHRALFRLHSPLAAETFVELLQQVKSKGQLDGLLARYYLQRPNDDLSE